MLIMAEQILIVLLFFEKVIWIMLLRDMENVCNYFVIDPIWNYLTEEQKRAILRSEG